MSIKNPSEEELKDILFKFEELNTDSPYPPEPVIDPIHLSDEQIAKLMDKLGMLKNPGLDNHIRKQLAEAAEYFPNELWKQKSPSRSEVRKEITTIRNAARKLLNSFKGKSDASRHMQYLIPNYLRIGAQEYGHRVMKGYSKSEWDVSWNFWGAYRLPAAIQSVELLEHWAALADEFIKTNAEREKKKTNKGNTAARVLIHRLALAWGHATGKSPGDGYDAIKGRADSPFIRFAGQFIGFLQDNITDAHRAHFPTIDKELDNLTPDAISHHLKTFKARLTKRPLR